MPPNEVPSRAELRAIAIARIVEEDLRTNSRRDIERALRDPLTYLDTIDGPGSLRPEVYKFHVSKHH